MVAVTTQKNLQKVFTLNTTQGSLPNDFWVTINDIAAGTTRVALRMDDLPKGAVVWSGNTDVSAGTTSLTADAQGHYALHVVLPAGQDALSAMTVSVTGYGSNGLATGSHVQTINPGYDVNVVTDSTLTFSSDTQNMWGDFTGYLGWHEYVPIVGGEAYVWDDKGDTDKTNDAWVAAIADAHWRTGNMTLLDVNVDSAQVLDAINTGATQAIDAAWQVYKSTAYTVDLVAKGVHNAAAATFKIAQDAYYTATHTVDAAVQATFNAAQSTYYAAVDVLNNARYAFSTVATGLYNVADVAWHAAQKIYYDCPNAFKWTIWLGFEAASLAHDVAVSAYETALGTWNTVQSNFQTGAQAVFNAAKIAYNVGEKAADAVAAATFKTAQQALTLADNAYKFAQDKVEQAAKVIYDKAVADVHGTLNQIAQKIDFDAGLKIDADIYAQLGLKIDAELDLGSVDTDLSYRLTSSSQYNEATDQLVITPLMTNLTGTAVAFSTVSPNIKFRAAIMYDVGADTTTTVSGQLTANGTQLFKVDPVTITKQITTNSVYQDTLEATSLLLAALPSYGPLTAAELLKAVNDAKTEAQAQGFDPGELVLVDFDSTTDLSVYKVPLIESLTDGAMTVTVALPLVRTQGVADTYTPGDFAEGDFVSVDYSEITSALLNTLNARFDYSADFLAKYPQVAALADAKTIADLVASFNDGLMALLKEQLDGKSEAVPVFLIDRTDQTSTSLLHLNTWADPDPASISNETGKFGFYTAYGESGTVVKATLDVDQLIAIITNEIAKKVVLAVTGVDLNALNLPIINQYNIETNLKQVLELAYVPKDVTEQIAKVIQLGYNFQQADLDVNAEANFSQAFSLSVEDMEFVATLEDGVKVNFTTNTAGGLKIDNASSHDANHDGQLSYTLDITPSATFWNDTEVGLALSYQLDYLKASMNAGITIPVGELLGINASWLNIKIPLANLDFGPLVRETGDLDLLSADIFETHFDLNVGSDSFSGVVTTKDAVPTSGAPRIVNLGGDSNSFVPGTPMYIDPAGGLYAYVSEAGKSNLAGGNLRIVQSTGTANGSYTFDARLYSSPMAAQTQAVVASANGGTTLKTDGSIAAGNTVWLINADNSKIQIGTVSATDSGQGGAALQINLTAAATVGDSAYNPGAVGTLLQALQYTAPTLGARSFSATVSDGTLTSGAATFGMNGCDLLVAENHPLVGGLSTLINLIGATPSDPTIKGVVSYTLSGSAADNGLFKIDAGTDVLRFVSAPDFEAPQDAGDGVHNNSYTIQVTATGSISGTVVKDLLIGVMNDAGADAKILNLQGDVAPFGLGGSPVAIDTGTPADLLTDPKASFNGGYLLISPLEGVNDGTFSLGVTSAFGLGVKSSPPGNGNSGIVADSQIVAGDIISVNGKACGTVLASQDGQGGHALRIDFNTAAAASDVSAILHSLKYLTPTLGARSFEVAVNDGIKSYETLTIGGDVFGDAASQVLQEVRVNDYIYTGNQYNAAITPLGGGNSVAVWESLGQDGQGWGIFGQRLDASGLAVGKEFRVNTVTYQSQTAPAVTALADGSFVVAWHSWYLATSNTSETIRAQHFGPDASLLGSEIVVSNREVSAALSSPAVTALSAGSFVVTGTTYRTVGWQYLPVIESHIYDAAGALLNPTKLILSPYDVKPIGGAPIATTALTDGGYLVIYPTNYRNSSDLVAQRFSADGTPQSNEWTINSVPGQIYTNIQVRSNPAIATLGNGHFVVSWEATAQDGSGQGIYAKLFREPVSGEAYPVALGGEILVNATTAGDQTHASIATLTGGGFVVAWQSADASGLGVYAQRFNASGVKIGGEFLVNSTTDGEQSTPSVCATADGGFEVLWQSADGFGLGVYSQRFDASGNRFTYTNVSGTDGNDNLNAAGAGSAHVYGRAGDDTYTVSASDHVFENSNAGTDTINTADSYALPDNVENLVLTGSANVNGFGNSLANTLTGNAGDNMLYGGAGNDIYVVVGTDTVVENSNEGTDTIRASAGFTLPANVENLVITGGLGMNGIGNSLANVLVGNSGNNLLQGAAGDDTLYGGAGDDMFLFDASGNGIDTITDFSLRDTMRVLGAPLAGSFTAGNGSTVAQNQIQYSNSGGVVTLYIGTDSTPGADLVVRLPGVNPSKLLVSQVFGTTGVISLDATGNVAPTVGSVTLGYTDTAADDVFASSSGTLAGADANGNVLTYGISGGTLNADGLNISKVGSYGTLTVNCVGGAYTYVPVDAAMEGAKANASDSFAVTATDGVLQAQNSLTVNVTGANDPTVIGNIVSDVGPTASGTLIVTDRDTGDAAITPQTATPGSAGTFTINSQGAWYYSLTASEARLQALAAGEHIVETFAVATAGGSSQNVVVTLDGANDAPTLGTLAPITLTDTSADDSFAPRTGTLAGHDLDTTNTLTYGITGGIVNAGVASKAGTYGTLTVNTSSGAYTFAPNDAAIEARTANASETFAVTVSDGTATASTSYTVNLTGANDTPTLTSITPLTGATEGTPYTITYAALAAAANEADRDAGASLSFRVESIASGSLTKGGNAVVPGTTTLGSGESLVWTAALSELGAFTVAAFDGMAASSLATRVTVEVKSVNNAPVLNASKSPMLLGITENLGTPSGNSTTGSTLVSALIDSGGALANFTDLDGNPAGIAITGVNSNGTLFFSTNGGTTWAAVGGVSATSARVLYADAQTRLYFQPDASYSGALADALTFKAWDRVGSYANGQTGVNTVAGNGNPVVAFSLMADAAGVTIADINNAPTLTATGATAVFNKDVSSAVDLFNNVTISTVESGQSIKALTLTVSNVADAGMESLRIGIANVVLGAGQTGSLGIGNSYTVSMAGSTATVALAFADGISALEAQALLGGMTYSNASQTPGTTQNRVITLADLKDSGGVLNGGVDTSAPGITATVAVSAPKQWPVIENLNADHPSFVVGSSAAVRVDTGTAVNVTYGGRTSFNAGTLSIAVGTTANVDVGWGTFSFDGTVVKAGTDGTIAAGETLSVGGIDIGTVSMATPTVTGGTAPLLIALNSAATPTHVATLLQNLYYREDPTKTSGGDSSITIALSDGEVSPQGMATIPLTGTVNKPPTGSVTITGTATRGAQLTASNSLADLDGLGTITYQWKAGGADIPSATGSTYILTPTEVDKTITVVARYTDLLSTAESVESTATGVVTALNNAPSGIVSFSGTATQGQTLTATNTLVDADGIPTSGAGAIAYQWSAGGVDIAGATNPTLVLGQDQVGKAITVTAKYTDSNGTTEMVPSSASAAVANVNDLPTGSVTIAGTVTRGAQLTASNSLADLDGLGTIRYQWKAGGTNISLATGSTYTLTQAEVGKAITVVAKYTDLLSTTESVESTTTGAVTAVNSAPTGTVSFTGTATQGQTLTASNNLADPDGMPASWGLYKWSANGVDIAGATNPTLVLGQDQVGKAITVTAKYTDNYGTIETVASSASAAVVNVNDLPTGSVTIAGTVTRGAQLTASNSLADLDGLGTISYQWKAGGTDIPAATGSTYTLTQAEVDKVITVVAKYTDLQSTQESVESTATGAVTAVNSAPTGTVSVTGTATEGQTLTAANTLVDADGIPTSGAGAITYHWSAGGVAIAGASNPTLVLGQVQVGKAITVTAKYTDSNGTTEMVPSSASAAVANVNDLPTGSVTIAGTATRGAQLTAFNSLADLDGLGTISYQWKAGGTDIPAATGSTYTLTQAEVDKVITVVAKYTDNYGTIETVASSASAAVANVNDLPTGSVTITGTATLGAQLTASNSLADLDGLGTITYQWKAGGTNITAATGSTYTLTQAEVGKAITVVAKYTDLLNTPESVESTATGAVTAVNSSPTGTVSFTGTAMQGQALTANNNLVDPDGMPASGVGAVVYKWSAGGVDITGATDPTLVLGQAQVGKTITVTAMYTDNNGTTETVASSASAAVANINDLPTGSVTIAGAATLGAQLTASNSVADVDGLGTITYQWKAGGTNIPAATGSTYTLTQAEVGKAITVVAKYTDLLNTPESVESTATGAVTALNNAPSGIVSFSGTATQGQTLTATNTLVDADGIPTSGAGAIAYQWSAGGVDISGATNPTLVLGQAQVGKTITVTAKYTDSNGTTEMVPSSASAAVANVNDLPNGTVTVTGTAKQAETLTATNTLADIDGIPTSGADSIAYQWFASDIAILGATSNKLVLADAQVGKTITVVAKYTDLFSTTESVSSTPTAAVLSAPKVEVSGNVQDGYVAGAAIYIDANGNGVADPAENTGVVTDAKGNFKLTTTLIGPVIATGGTNVDTGLANTLALTAPQGSTVISPLTTVIQAYAKSAGVSAAAAETAVQTAMGITGDVDLTKYDPLAQTAGDTTALAVQKATAQVAQVGIRSQDNGVQFTAITTALADGIKTGQTINLSDRTALQTVLGTVAPAKALDAASTTNTAIATATSLTSIATIQTIAGDTVAPTVSTLSPANGATSVGVSGNIVVKFSETIQRGTGSIVVKDAAGNVLETYDAATSPNLSIADSTLTLSRGFTFANSATYKIDIAAGSITDLAGNAYAGTSSYSFTTVDDRIPPTPLFFTPADKATDAVIGADIVVTFSEDIQRGSGTIVLKDAAGGTLATYDASNSANVSVTGNVLTINPSADLAYSTGYKVEFAAGVVKDTVGNAFAGNTSYTFTTQAPPNRLPTGGITLAGTPTQGQTLTLSTATLADADGLGALSYQWLRGTSPITGATATTFTLTQADVGALISAKVSYTDGRGAQEVVVSAATTAVANVNDAPTGGVTIPSTASQGNTLVANTSTLDDLDGLGRLQYQWLRDGKALPNANASSYDPTQADVGTAISVQVSYVDKLGANEAVTSNATAPVVNVNDLPTGGVIVTGKIAQGQTVSADVSTIKDADGLGTLSYQWLNGNTAIAGATSSTYLIANALLDAVLNVRVSYTDGFGAVESIASTSSTNVADGLPPVAASFSPADESTGVTLGTKIEVYFNEIILKGTGNITLKTMEGVTVAAYDVAKSGNVFVSGSTLSIYPSNLLATATTYRVELGANTVKDLSGNNFVGLTSYNFTTIAGPDDQTLTGSAVNDSFTGGVGNDVIDGGAGVDTAIFSGKITDYVIKYNRALGTATVTDHRANGDGTDSLKSIEKLQFGDKTFDLVNLPLTVTPAYGKTASFLFDSAFYLLKNSDLVPTVTLATAFDSFKATASKGAAPNSWFDPVYYANKWTDLKALNLDAATLFTHYNLYGVWEGRSAGAMFDKFDGSKYLSDNPDVAAYVDAHLADFLGSRSNGAIAHYVIYGANEGRLAYDATGVAIEQAILIGVPG